MRMVFSEIAKPPVVLLVKKRKKCSRAKGVVVTPRGGGRFGLVGSLPFGRYSPLLRQEMHWSPSFLARIFVFPQVLHAPMLLLGMLLFNNNFYFFISSTVTSLCLSLFAHEYHF